MIQGDSWGDEPTQVERDAPWLETNFAELPTYRAPVAGRYDNDNETLSEMPAIGGE